MQDEDRPPNPRRGRDAEQPRRPRRRHDRPVHQAGGAVRLDNLRDSATHYYLIIAEDQLYVFAQGSVALYDLLLQKANTIRLGDHLPARVLPISSRPPRDLHVLVDAEFNNLREAVRGLKI